MRAVLASRRRRAALLLGLAAMLAPALAPAVVAPAVAGERDGAREPLQLSRREFARVELGRRLFFDPAASPSGRASCASCHSPDHGWSDPARVSADDVGDTQRHSQTLLDAAYHATAHWDGEFTSVAQLVAARVGRDLTGRGGPGYSAGPFTPSPSGPSTPRERSAPVTPGERRPLATHQAVHPAASDAVPIRLLQGGRYAEGFRRAFGSDSITVERIALAIAAFTHTIESTPAAYDRYVAGERNALSPAARRGLALFEGRAGCAQCHSTKGERPFFTDFAFHNTGIAHDSFLASARAPGSFDALRTEVLRNALQQSGGRNEAVLAMLADAGRATRSHREEDLRAFKTPTLRDVARRGPYMHDGRFDTLAEVVGYYAKGCGEDPDRSALLKPFACSDRDTADLVAFLESLDGETRAARAERLWSARARRTVVTIVDRGGEPLAGLPVELLAVGDDVPTGTRRVGPERVTAVTDGRGRIRFTPAARTHTRVVLPDGIQPTHGALVPDTCASATVQMPVRGHMTLLVTFQADEPVPAFLLGTHPGTPRQPGEAPARTLLRRTGPPIALQGGRFARYRGWARMDFGPMKLEIPRLGAPEARAAPRPGMVYEVRPDVTYRLDTRPDARR